MHPLRSGGPSFSEASGYGWEEDESGASWLLSYVDMLSVVLALMVMLLGHLAAQHMEPAHTPTVAVANKTESVSPTATPAIVQESEAVIAKTDVAPLPLVLSPQLIELRPITTPLPAEPMQNTTTSEAAARLTEAVEQRLGGLVQSVQREHGVSLAIAEAILFESGKAELRKEAQPLLAQLVTALQEAGDAQVEVEGHTDSRPIHTGRYESNWELAAARATAVTRFLIDQGLPPHRLRSVSYADTRPVSDEPSPDGYAQNRRVNLMVEFQSSAPESAPASNVGYIR